MGVCWEWEGAQKPTGYGNFAPVRSQTVLAHRWAWEYLIGPIPPGMELDHRCKNTRCVCPDHLEIVTSQENTRRASKGKRRDFCARGHHFTPENTYIDKKGGRICRTCIRDGRRRRAHDAEMVAA